MTPFQLTQIEILETVSIVIPVAHNDPAWKNLLPDLDQLPQKTQILFVADETNNSSEWNQFFQARFPHVSWLVIEGSRAKKLNEGANLTCNQWIWFLHADSNFTDNTS